MTTAALLLIAAAFGQTLNYDLEPPRPAAGPQAYVDARQAAAERVVFCQVVDSSSDAVATESKTRLIALDQWPPGPARDWLTTTPRPYIMVLAPGGPTGVTFSRVFAIQSPRTAQTRQGADGSR